MRVLRALDLKDGNLKVTSRSYVEDVCKRRQDQSSLPLNNWVRAMLHGMYARFVHDDEWGWKGDLAQGGVLSGPMGRTPNGK